MNIEKKLQIIKINIEKINKLVKYTTNQALIFFGNSGSGKSTIANLFIGNTLYSKYLFGIPVWDIKENQTNFNFQIFHQNDISTFYPKQIQIKIKDKFYTVFDIAGFQNNRSDYDNISIYYSYFHILSSVEKMKIFLCIQLNNLKEKYINKKIDPLINLLNLFHFTDQKGFQRFCQSIVLIITKSNDNKHYNFQNILLDIVNKYKQSSTQQKRIKKALKIIFKKNFIIQEPSLNSFTQQTLTLNQNQLTNILQKSNYYEKAKIKCDVKYNDLIQDIIKQQSYVLKQFIFYICQCIKQISQSSEKLNYQFWNKWQNFIKLMSNYSKDNISPLPQRNPFEYFQYLSFFDQLTLFINQIVKLNDPQEQPKQQDKKQKRQIIISNINDIRNDQEKVMILQNQRKINKLKLLNKILNNFVQLIYNCFAKNQTEKLIWRQFRYQFNRLQNQIQFFNTISKNQKIEIQQLLFEIKKCIQIQNIHQKKAMEMNILRGMQIQYYENALSHINRYNQIKQFNNKKSIIYQQISKNVDNKKEKLNYLLKAFNQRKVYFNSQKYCQIIQNKSLILSIGNFLMDNNLYIQAKDFFKQIHQYRNTIKAYNNIIMIAPIFSNYIQFGNYYKSILLIQNAKEQFLMAKEVGLNQEQKLLAMKLWIQAQNINQIKQKIKNMIEKKQFFNKLDLQKTIKRLKEQQLK